MNLSESGSDSGGMNGHGLGWEQGAVRPTDAVAVWDGLERISRGIALS